MISNRYIPLSDDDLASMRATVGVPNDSELFSECPPDSALDPSALARALPSSTEAEVLAAALCAARGTPPGARLLGGGVDPVEIPAVVEWGANLGSFLTAYTPYQAEVSQGTLAVLFEFQTMISELFALPVAGAGVYDGGSALAEAVRMACASNDRRRVLLSDGVADRVRDVVVAHHPDLDVAILPSDAARGVASLDTVRAALDAAPAACLALAEPNRWGLLEPDLPAAFAAARAKGTVPIALTHPIALGALRAPGEVGAEIAVAEGQCLGSHLGGGGPYLGLIASSEAYLRRFPGRVVGETVDRDGRRAWCLTLQAREQHIRRERATSNICTNQTNNALRAMLFLAALGPRGLRDLAERTYALTRAAVRIARARGGATPGLAPRFPDAPALGGVALADGRVLSLWGVSDEAEIEAAL